MKIILTTLTFIFFTLLFANPVSAWSSYSLGNTDFYDYGRGSGTGYNIGNSYFYNDSFGWRGDSYGIGDSTFYDYNNSSYDTSLRGSSSSIGGTEFYNFNDNYGNSYSGNQYRVGSTDFYQFGNLRFSCYWVGKTYFCN